MNDERIDDYLAAIDAQTAAAQDDLFGDAAQPPAANGAYQE